MQLSENQHIAKTHGAARVVIRRRGIMVRLERRVERGQKIFDVTFQIVEIKFAFDFMNILRSQSAGRRHDQRAALPTVVVNLADFVQLEIANPAVGVPLNRSQDARHQ